MLLYFLTFFLSDSTLSCQGAISLCWGYSTYLCTLALRWVSLLGFVICVCCPTSILCLFFPFHLIMSQEPTTQLSICHLWQSSHSLIHHLFFPFHLIMSQEPTTWKSQWIWDTSYRHCTTWSLPDIISVHITIMHSYVTMVLIFFQRALLLCCLPVIIITYCELFSRESCVTFNGTSWFR